ncbi:MAG: hypothetical protein R3D84_07870 [Paracoccaceae bacterium]
MIGTSVDPASPTPAPRPPEMAMRLDRMGSAHPTRLSFLRIMLRRMRDEGWRFDRALFDLDSRGVGRAVYCLHGPVRSYSLVAFAHDLPDDMRTDRVIATAWDATFAFFDGVPETADLDRLAANVPLQEAGRVSTRELSLSRANRSVRLFSHVVSALAEGRQPDRAELDAVGYLMRTTAVYGSGKFGAQDRAAIAGRPELAAPFQAEMMSVWLTRAFTVDLVNHLARERGGDRAARLDAGLARSLGVGNSTGLGMAPFLVRHPRLLHAWAAARETALARVRGKAAPTPKERAALCEAVEDARENARHWHSEHPLQQEKLRALRADLAAAADLIDSWPAPGDPQPWNSLWLWGEAHLSLEGQEALLSILLEPCGALVDDLARDLSAREAPAWPIDGAMSVAAMREAIATRYGWALRYDFTDRAELARFWYVSEEKLEPRLGERFAEAGAEREMPLGIAHRVRLADDALGAADPESTLAAFLLAHPEHRMAIRRVQMLADCPYGEIAENLLGGGILPIDMMRYKLAFFGASHFDPRSDKWVRISLFAGLPGPEEIGDYDGRL